MPKKWNLQDIRPARPATPNDVMQQQTAAAPRRMGQDIAPKRHIPQDEPLVSDPDLERIEIVDGNASKRKRVILLTSIAAVVLGGAFFLNILMGGAEVTVYPKFKDVSVQANFTAYKEPPAGELGYELLSLEATGERQVKASGSEQVSERAIGDMLIYNTDTKATQRLIKNTRFESPTGLIYRIQESVEVPKATTNASGGDLSPGVVKAKVFADGTGETYNIPPARFTVPGLKSTPQFSTVYGETSVTMAGGFEGERYLLDEAELETKKQELHLELRNSLLERLQAERPSGFIMYPDAVTFTFESLPSTSYGDALATIKEKAVLHVPLFKADEFASYIAESTVPGYEDEQIMLQDPTTLVFEYGEASTSLSDLSESTELSFLLKGLTRLVWEFDEEALMKSLLGLPKESLGGALGSYPSIERAEAVIRPFWSQEFPETTDKMQITTIIEKKEDKEAE